jgi:hypothetical protein
MQSGSDPSDFNLKLPPQLAQDPLFERLSAADRTEFVQLSNRFILIGADSKRNYGLTTFIQHLSAIHHFVVQGNQDDLRRGLLCGIEFTSHALVVNTGKIKRLLCKSKSCINGCFHRMGYEVCKAFRDLPSLFAEIDPEYASSPSFIGRQWCVRRLTANATVCFIPNLSLELIDSYGDTQTRTRDPISTCRFEHFRLDDPPGGVTQLDDFKCAIHQLLNGAHGVAIRK